MQILFFARLLVVVVVLLSIACFFFYSQTSCFVYTRRAPFVAMPGDVDGLRIPKVVQAGFHVCLVCTVWDDERDPFFRVPLLKAFDSLAKQTFRNWTLILVGDGLNPPAVGELFCSLERARIPMERVLFRNMAASSREVNVFRGLSREDLYKLGPVNAQRIGFRLSESSASCTHTATWSYDDFYHADHLEVFSAAFAQFPTVAFMFSAIRYDSKNFSTPSTDYPLGPNNYGPLHASTPFPTWMWSLARLNFDMRSYPELLLKGKLQYADADAVARIEKLRDSDIIQIMFIPKVTVTYTAGKARLFAAIREMSNRSECQRV